MLRAAWRADRADRQTALEDILAARAALPGVLRRVVQRSMHLHGVIGVSSEMPFAKWPTWAEAVAVAEGPTEKGGWAAHVRSGWLTPPL